jgi:hypothetical protein
MVLISSASIVMIWSAHYSLIRYYILISAHITSELLLIQYMFMSPQACILAHNPVPLPKPIFSLQSMQNASSSSPWLEYFWVSLGRRAFEHLLLINPVKRVCSCNYSRKMPNRQLRVHPDPGTDKHVRREHVYVLSPRKRSGVMRKAGCPVCWTQHREERRGKKGNVPREKQNRRRMEKEEPKVLK